MCLVKELKKTYEKFLGGDKKKRKMLLRLKG